MWISRSHPLLLGHSFLGQIMHPCFGRRRRGALMWTLDGAQRDLERRKRAMLKDSTVALLPDVPQGVNNIAVKRPPTVLLVSSCATELFFLLTRSKRCGARLRGASPSSQLWCQNLALLPLPIVTEVEAWNNKRSMLLHGTWSPTQGFEPSIHSCHN
ncbi:hypothetical protein U9M48_041136 [Paspalum notatum var. saurae]|uniref:Uncharacterized protein n=1 Tax=Paspalum notatum var. saurae TaxID=547442 RepID=A0AAQ3US18_PASNO